ncbi:MAG: hypothetical protein M0R70_09305 [Nitrospirae bacterium]|nr:hypothetical protein [Nitrospirota bacterium]
MVNRIVLVVVLACLTAFGLRGVLPALFESNSISAYADILFLLAAVVLFGVAVYEAFIKTSPAPKLK